VLDCYPQIDQSNLKSDNFDNNFDYSEPPNTRPSGIQMVIFRTLFKSGF
jgi:hypothetical protein